MSEKKKKEPEILTDVEIVDAGAEGMSVAKPDGRVVFIPFGVPGDIVDIQVFKRKKNFFEGKIINLKRPSEKRIGPVCEHFGLCGGCKWQQMDYQWQLFYKEKQVRDNIERIGKVEYDDIQDPLPFDVNAPIINIQDEDYALWYRDMSEEPKKYEGKKVRFKAKTLKRKRLPPKTFVIGRHVMTCCVEDIQFAALVCNWDKADTVKDEGWMILTAKVNFKFSMAYGRKGPVLTYLSHEECEPPAEAVATFY